MRKFMNIFAAVLVMLAAASCEKNEVLTEGNTEGKVVTLKAYINNGVTKTSLGVKDGDTYPVLWSEGDAIAVIQTNGVGENQPARIFKFVLKEEDGGKTSGEFELEISENCGYTAEDFNASEEIIAFYPFEDVHYSGIKVENQFNITYNIPDVQVYATNTFEKGASPMVAYRATDANGTLSFQNLFGVLKLQLQGANEKVQSIEIISSTYIAGDETGLTTSNKESLQFEYRFGSLDGRKRVTLDCGNDGVSINNLTTFMIALHPNATDLEVFIHTDKASYYKTIPTLDVNETPINDITAGNILAMGGLNTADMAPAYIDERGIYQGDGIEVSGIIWAPVNCGYDEDHKYGLLYQWGRKYGQGYDGETPSVEKVDGPISSAEVGNNQDNQNKFYKNNRENNKDWLSTSNDKLWESSKTQYDPCPNGWRVPTDAEMKSLFNYDYLNNGSSSQYVYFTSDKVDNYWTANGGSSNDMLGLYCYGSTMETSGNKIFLPAAGQRKNSEQFQGAYRGTSGFYWTSGAGISLKFYYNSDERKCTITRSTNSNQNGGRASGFSVRCVKE